jgi:F-type H+-transporting ATPase subunit delta
MAITQDARGFVAGVVDYLRSEGRVSHSVPKVQNLLYKMTSSARKERQAIVESAVKLTAAEELGIAKALSRVVGHQVSLDCHVNTHLIGGIRIQMADWVVDTSIKAQLAQMAAIVS